MDNKNWVNRIGMVFAWLALGVMAVGIGALSYAARSQHTASTGEFWQWMSLVVAFAPALSTMVVAYFKFFGVSSREHDSWLWVAFGIDMVAIISQLLTVALLGTQDGILQFFWTASFVLSALSFVAVAIAAGFSNHRLQMVSERERDAKIQDALNETVVATLKSPEMYEAGLVLANDLVTSRFETLTGRRLLSLNGGTSGGTSARLIVPDGKKKYVVVDGQVVKGKASADGGTKRGRPRKDASYNPAESFSLNQDAPKVEFKAKKAKN